MFNSHLLPYFIFSTLLITASTLAVIISLVINKQRQVRNRLARQQLEFEYSQSLLNTRVEVREATLNMLAQELHDNITQAMTGCFIEVTAAAEHIHNEGGRAIIKDAKEHMMHVIRDVRLLSHSLATGMVEHRALDEAIQAELTRIQTFTNIKCTIESDTLIDLQPDQRLLLFRVVQEALQNTLKHANATSISVSISNDEEYFYLKIVDDGAGFDTTMSPINKSLGLLNIQERVKKLHGIINVESKPGEGTSIRLHIPISLHNESDKNSNSGRLYARA